ncbi:conserved hypothetical protein [Lodderomyces elongisporus NRRL YB-4239]|uniref:Uncharacterized protein n=1 Tax=Lodderomyces elongisporus (strain ATCC 11503 / CBS 2605 / JCM 1781 / NBRC 1676 / NRRL YB-4239) TaxID=379508 RepID=A5DRQ3_LODEL|nr:conserved hypothetical protein [Lodderomyces elongisporus NRRL YB-4239]
MRLMRFWMHMLDLTRPMRKKICMEMHSNPSPSRQHFAPPLSTRKSKLKVHKLQLVNRPCTFKQGYYRHLLAQVANHNTGHPTPLVAAVVVVLVVVVIEEKFLLATLSSTLIERRMVRKLICRQTLRLRQKLRVVSMMKSLTLVPAILIMTLISKVMPLIMATLPSP